MSTVVDDIHVIAVKVAPYVAFAQVAEHALGIGGAPAEGILAVIKAGVDALAKGASGELTADQVTAELEALKVRVKSGEAADDAEADAIVAARRGVPSAP